jgi:hypothetical protein
MMRIVCPSFSVFLKFLKKQFAYKIKLLPPAIAELLEQSTCHLKLEGSNPVACTIKILRS